MREDAAKVRMDAKQARKRDKYKAKVRANATKQFESDI